MITKEQLAALEVGDSLRLAGDVSNQPWSANTQADWAVVDAYATENWPVQFELVNGWAKGQNGAEVRTYTAMRIR